MRYLPTAFCNVMVCMLCIFSTVNSRKNTIINKKNKNTMLKHCLLFQTLTSSWACKVKVPGCEENAIELLQLWMDQPNPDEYNPSVHNILNTYAVHMRTCR